MKTKLLIFSLFLFTSVVTSQVTRIKDNDNIPAPKAVSVSETTGSTEGVEVDVSFAVLEDVPRFEVCKDSTVQTAKECFVKEMSNHIIKNFKYPLEAKKANIQGRVTVLFVINKEGDIEKIRTRGPKNGVLLEQEALRIIKLLPKFKPGMQRGKPVAVSYAQPISFKLEEPIKKTTKNSDSK